MGLIERIKTALGLDTQRQGSQSAPSDESTAQDVGVTVEREPDTTTEDAVKGTDSEAADDAVTETAEDAVTETAEDAVTETAEETTTDSAVESEPPASGTDSPADADETSPEPEAGATEDVQSIKGIGPAYAERLADADVETVDDLAAADAGTIAEQTGIAESRVATWIEQANQ